MERICTKCKIPKNIDTDFYKSTHSCKQCRKEYQAFVRAEQRSKILKGMKEEIITPLVTENQLRIMELNSIILAKNNLFQNVHARSVVDLIAATDDFLNRGIK